jgi:hypothetical protein
MHSAPFVRSTSNNEDWRTFSMSEAATGFPVPAQAAVQQALKRLSNCPPVRIKVKENRLLSGFQTVWMGAMAPADAEASASYHLSHIGKGLVFSSLTGFREQENLSHRTQEGRERQLHKKQAAKTGGLDYKHHCS